MTYRHIVLVRFKPEATDADRTAYHAAVERLHREAGRPSQGGFNVGSGSNHYDYAAVTDFADEAAFRSYLASPEHKA